eukprot:NODE_172_length_14331_cov_0.709177.p3 type:complete len:405 gc:universal NODE_172_length_14331_cov_0.709177:3024-1810(-)
MILFSILQATNFTCFSSEDQICLRGYIIGDQARVEIKFKEGFNWGAIGFGQGMSDADVVTYEQYPMYNQSYLRARRAIRPGRPVVVYNVSLVEIEKFTTFDNYTTVVFSLPLIANYPFEKNITEGLNDIIWAYGYQTLVDDEPNIKKHVDRGSASLYFSTLESPSNSASKEIKWNVEETSSEITSQTQRRSNSDSSTYLLKADSTSLFSMASTSLETNILYSSLEKSNSQMISSLSMTDSRMSSLLSNTGVSKDLLTESSNSLTSVLVNSESSLKIMSSIKPTTLWAIGTESTIDADHKFSSATLRLEATSTYGSTEFEKVSSTVRNISTEVSMEATQFSTSTVAGNYDRVTNGPVGVGKSNSYRNCRRNKIRDNCSESNNYKWRVPPFCVAILSEHFCEYAIN